MGQNFESRNTKVEMKDVVKHVVIDDAAINERDAFEIIEPIRWISNIYDGEEEYIKSVSSFSENQIMIHAIFTYIAEVDNGGHDQFYFNSSGIVWRNALKGFRTIGLEEVALILEESNNRMGGDPSLDRSERIRALDVLKPDFNDLDERLYEFERTTDIDKVLLDYIKKHKTDFYFEGDVNETIFGED